MVENKDLCGTGATCLAMVDITKLIVILVCCLQVSNWSVRKQCTLKYTVVRLLLRTRAARYVRMTVANTFALWKIPRNVSEFDRTSMNK